MDVTSDARASVPRGRRVAKAIRRPRPHIWFLLPAVALYVGFFIVPVVGLVVGFVVGTYASECQRIGPRSAWPSTKAALRAVGVSMLLELASVLLATTAWIIGVIVT